MLNTKEQKAVDLTIARFNRAVLLIEENFGIKQTVDVDFENWLLNKCLDARYDDTTTEEICNKKHTIVSKLFAAFKDTERRGSIEFSLLDNPDFKIWEFLEGSHVFDFVSFKQNFDAGMTDFEILTAQQAREIEGKVQIADLKGENAVIVKKDGVCGLKFPFFRAMQIDEKIADAFVDAYQNEQGFLFL